MEGNISKREIPAGGGISGLAAARECIAAGLLPRIFETTSSIGGLWSSESTTCRRSMRTNISRHTCSFSDHFWPLNTTAFPTASEMALYLENFRKEHIPMSMISLNHQVTNVLRDGDQWSISWKATSEQTATYLFDHLIIASGFFCSPFSPTLQGMDTFTGRVMHSSEYRTFDTIRNKTVAIVGDSYSAVEVAGEVAPFARSVTHIHPRPFYTFPKHIPFDPCSPNSAFAPLDLVFYSRSKHRSSTENSIPTKEQIRDKNQYFRSLCGDQGPGLLVEDDGLPYVAISDTYANAVRDGSIKPVRGRLAAIQEGGSLQLGNGDKVNENFDIVIMATGFTTGLPFLDESIRLSLEFEPDDRRTPILLHRNVFHPSLPNAAFVGMYRGPYMGVIELQAKWAAQVFAGNLPAPSQGAQLASIKTERAIRAQDPPLQFPHADYVGIMLDLARELGIDPQSVWGSEHPSIDIVTPASFGSGPRAASLMTDVHTQLKEARRGKYVQSAVYSGWQGEWQLSRRLLSYARNYPSGTFTGTAKFSRLPIAPQDMSTLSSAEVNGVESCEYKYTESGKLVTDNGLEFDAQRRYRYQLSDGPETRINAFFDDSSGEGFFHSLRILAPDEDAPKDQFDGTWEPWVGERRPGWRGVGDHWCQPDQYTCAYWFTFSGVNLAEFRISYRVKGPNKDYVASATYTRRN